MTLKKIENSLEYLFVLSNPLTYCYLIGFLAGALIKEANDSVVLLIKDMRR